jgi:hypothetical protein
LIYPGILPVEPIRVVSLMSGVAGSADVIPVDSSTTSSARAQAAEGCMAHHTLGGPAAKLDLGD